MSLPMNVHPEFEVELPSSKILGTPSKIKIRPFLVKEQKILFMAFEGKDSEEIKNSVIQVLNNCVLGEGIDIEALPFFDIDYLFLQLRSKSIGESVQVRLVHQNNEECEHVHELEVNVDDIKVVFPEEHTSKIMVNDNIGIEMHYPSMKMYSNMEGVLSKDEPSAQDVIDLIKVCAKCIYDQNDVYDDYTDEELEAWIENLTQDQFMKIVDFFRTMPSLSKEFKWTCPECKVEEEVTVKGLVNFFT
jgi:hypothetical protein